MHAVHEDRSYPSNLPATAFAANSMSFFAHWHAEVELIQVCEGSILVGINHETRVLHQGDMAVCSSGDIHFYDCKGYDSIIRLIIFRPELVDSAGGWPRAFAFDSPFFCGQTCSALLRSYENAFLAIKEEATKKDALAPMLVKGSLLTLCATLARTASFHTIVTKKPAAGRHRMQSMQDALSFIESNYMADIRLQDAAAAANMSIYHFSRLFMSVAGMGYKSYLSQLRVNKAEALLKNSDNTITEIALQCGFDSIRTFNRVFRAVHGSTPSRAR